jgi:branched-chain amino acid transport system substrate-binding protein
MDAATKSANIGTASIKIGVGAPLSGRGGDLGLEMAQAVQLAVDEANESIGVDGVQLQARVLDDEGDEEQGVKVAQAFAEDDQVVAVIGHYNSNVTLRVASLYAEVELPLISPIVSNPRLTNSGWTNVFRFTNRDDATADAIAGYMVENLGKRCAVIVTTNTIYGASMSREFIRAFEYAGGKVLRHVIIEEGEQDFHELVRVLPADMDTLFYGGTFEGAPILRALRAKGLHQLMATGDGCWDIGNFLEPAGPTAEEGEGVLILSACPELGTVPGSQDFANRYARRFGPIKNYAVNSYDAAALLIGSIRTAALSGLGRGSVLSALRHRRHRGIAYPEAVSWDSSGDNNAALTALHVVRDGRYRQIAMM